jgi:hypothetical protein
MKASSSFRRQGSKAFCINDEEELDFLRVPEEKFVASAAN